MSTVTKLTPNGTFYIAGTLDEATFNPNSGYIKNQVVNTIGNPFSVTAGGGTIISTNELAPDGTYTAIRFRPIQQYSGLRTNACWLPNVIQTGSVWCRVGSGTQAMQLGLNGGGLSVNFTANSTWQRFNTGPFTKTANYTDFFSIFNYNTSNFIDFIVWGPQVELGNVATIYEATDAAGKPALNTSNKLDANGNYYIAGTFDEVTYNQSSGVKKNLLSYSQDLTQWTGALGNQGPPNTTAAATNVLSPDGLSYASLISITTPANAFRQTVTVVPNTTYTFSFYALRGTATNLVYSVYDTVNNNNISAGISYYNQTNAYTWSRISVTFTTPGGCTQVGVYPERDNGATGTVYIWGCQLELGNTATVYEATGANATPLKTNFSKRVDPSGNDYITSNYDELSLNSVSSIVNTGLILSLDPANQVSYPGYPAGNYWYDLSPYGNNGILTNAPNGSGQAGISYNTSGGGSLLFSGYSTYATFTVPQLATANTVTLEYFMNWSGNGSTMPWSLDRITDIYTTGQNFGYNSYNSNCVGLSYNQMLSIGAINNWAHFVCVVNTTGYL